jgi:hypothetical protein
VLILPRKARGLTLVNYAEGQALTPRPAGGAPVRIAVDEKGRLVILEERRKMDGTSRLRLSTFEARNGDDHICPTKMLRFRPLEMLNG